MADRTVQRYVRGDEWGNDPLRHTIYANLNRITRYSEHTVTPDEEGNPVLIADAYYGNPEFDFVILAYNGIGDGMSIRSGQVLRIPSSAQVEALSRETKPRSVKI